MALELGVLRASWNSEKGVADGEENSGLCSERSMDGVTLKWGGGVGYKGGEAGRQRSLLCCAE